MKISLEKIKFVVTDVDGVLTDGYLTIGEDGSWHKRIFYRDIDAVTLGRKIGIEFAIISGEDSNFVDLIGNRLGIRKIFRGKRDKLAALQQLSQNENISSEEICYIGDAKRDASAISWAGFGVAPSESSTEAMSAADYITKRKGGIGVLEEVIDMISSIHKK